MCKGVKILGVFCKLQTLENPKDFPHPMSLLPEFVEISKDLRDLSIQKLQGFAENIKTEYLNNYNKEI